MSRLSEFGVFDAAYQKLNALVMRDQAGDRALAVARNPGVKVRGRNGARDVRYSEAEIQSRVEQVKAENEVSGAEDKKTFRLTPEEVNARNEKGETILHLIANLDTRNLDDLVGGTPEDNEGRIKTYIARCKEYGADVNAKDKDGNTPLHLAAQNGQAQDVIGLVKYGADINLANKDGKTPLSLAYETHGLNPSNIWLLKHGAAKDAIGDKAHDPVALIADSALRLKAGRDVKAERKQFKESFAAIIKESGKSKEEQKDLIKHLGSYWRETLDEPGKKIDRGVGAKLADKWQNFMKSQGKETSRDKAHSMIKQLIESKPDQASAPVVSSTADRVKRIQGAAPGRA